MRSAAVLVLLFLGTFPMHAALVPGPERPVSPPQLGPATINEVRDVATDGTDFLTLWSDNSVPREGVYASIVNEQGVPRAVAPAPLQRGPALAHAVWTGDAYLVVLYANDGQHTTLRLNRDAQVLSERTPIDVGTGYVVELAWNGSRALAIVSGPSRTLSAALLDGNGRVVRSGIPLPAQGHEALTATAAGDAFVVAWAEEREPQQVGRPPLMAVRAVRISSEGDVSAPKELLEPTVGMVEIHSASSGNDAGIAFTTYDYRKTFRELLRFTIDGPTFAVETHPAMNLLPIVEELRVVPVSGGFAVAYAFYPSQSLSLGVVRFDATATRSFPLGPVGLIGRMFVETNGRNVVAVLHSSTAVAIALDRNLTQRTSEPVPASLSWTQQGSPAMASAGDTMLMAWLEYDYPNGSRLMVQRRDAAGNALDAEPKLLAYTVADAPAIVFTGRVWMLAWSRGGFSSTGAISNVFVQRVSPEGLVLDAQPIDVGQGWNPALASNAQVTALVMGHLRTEPVRLVRFTPDGNLIDSTPLAPAGVETDTPSIATNGQEFLVTWGVQRRNVSGRRLAADGTPMDAAPIAIAHGPLPEDAAQVASNGTDFVVVYVQWTPQPIVDPPLENPPPPPPSRVLTKRVLRNGTLADATPDQDGSLLGEGTLPNITAFEGGYAVTFIAPQAQPYDRLSLFALPLDARGVLLAPPRPVFVNAHSYSTTHALAAVGDSLQIAYARLSPQLGDVHRVYLRTLTEQASRRRASRK